MSTILEVNSLSKKYGDFEAVKGISFDIKAGEIFSLLGPNGAGKTTTISVLSCLLKPTSGDALIGGYSVVRESLKVREIIGVVPQDIALYNMLSARENLKVIPTPMFMRGVFSVAGFHSAPPLEPTGLVPLASLTNVGPVPGIWHASVGQPHAWTGQGLVALAGAGPGWTLAAPLDCPLTETKSTS